MRNIIRLWFFISALLVGLPANSATLTPLTSFSFGTFTILNNATTSDIRITLAGSTLPTNQIIVLIPGQTGEYTLHDDFAFTEIFTTVNIISAETTSNPPSPVQLTLVAVETALSVTTDANGDAPIIIGGTMRTSGTGGQYTNATYTAVINFDVNY